MKQLLFLTFLAFVVLYAKSDFIYETREEVVAYTGPIKETHRNPIQDVIDNAKEGSIIKLKAGVYEGNIVITKPISIVGVEEGVIIDGLGAGSVITIRSSYVTLKNLVIQNSGDRADIPDAAINMIGDTKTGALVQNEISDCKILDSLVGINLEIVNNSLFKNNFITSKNYELGLRGDGIRLWYSNDNII